MNNITKYLLIFISLVAISFAAYYYFQYIGELNDNLDPIEEREEQRTVDIDSIVKERTSKLEDSIADLTELIKKLEKYEPPKVDNSDIIPRNIRYKDSLLTVYYPNN